jgi:hypothetical protein
MLYDPKYPILKYFDPELIPRTILITSHTDIEEIRAKMQDAELVFPLIVKPDIGERGIGVEKVQTEKDLERYHRQVNYDYLIQEYVDLPLEIGVFYYRYPDEESGLVSSIVIKEMLKVTGDGNSTVEELMSKYPRARLQLDSLSVKFPKLMDEIPEEGEVLELEAIGNHNRGTTFLDGQDLINEELREIIEGLARKVPGFYYGRFDMRCGSVEELNRGVNFKILELNGAKSEPAHIYQPGYPILKAYKSIFHHWIVMFRISQINHHRGFEYQGFWKCLPVYRKYRGYLKMVKSR